MASPDCSVIQGSRLSGWMFNAYCNEIPQIPKLINTDIYFKLVENKKLDIKNISHSVHNFIDDSSNIIGFRNHNTIKNYLEKYYILLSKYYNINMLKLNNDKNKMIVINRPKWDSIFKNFSFRANGELVEAKFKMKILGKWIQNDLKMDAEINKLSSSLHNRINIVSKIKKYTDFKSR